ncbi:Na+/H+ antiporter NhaA [Gammaproteobacteria bacterium ESL0073]|nr:Na+/H+ antiporter NhaA [Gammaproteobacteria bacterium ESL0073]
MRKPALPKLHAVTQRSFSAINHFLHIEAVGGLILFFIAIIALLWANSPFADSYHALWHMPIGITLGSFHFSQSLHFWINDVLMTFFFLVVGMEIRKEIYDGALSNLRVALLPLAAALGGVIAPALIYLSLNHSPDQIKGWAVPTATDIAFAVGALAVLGKSIPSNIRIFLLALAIIDDIVAVLIIAFFYSGGFDTTGLILAVVGILLVLFFQWLGFRSAFAYLIPGAILWSGLFIAGAHPTLAGVILGLMTPVVTHYSKETCVSSVSKAIEAIQSSDQYETITDSAFHLHKVQRELLPPVTRINMTLHPWVTFGIMPLFALANAGITVGDLDLSLASAHHVMFGVMVALILGKPLGILLFSFTMVKLGICQFPKGINLAGILLIGLLGGIGFTMSIFIANLAFTNETLLGAAKAGVLLGSLLSIIIGLGWGYIYKKKFSH